MRKVPHFANRLEPAEKEELAMSNPEIAEAMEASDRFMMDDKAYFEYLQRESAIWDYNNDMAGSREEGRAEGRVETWVASVKNIMNNRKMTAQQAVEAVAVPAQFRKQVLEQLGQG